MEALTRPRVRGLFGAVVVAMMLALLAPGVAAADARCGGTKAGVQVWSNEYYSGYTQTFCPSGTVLRLPNLADYGGGGPLPGDTWNDVIDSFQSFNMDANKRSCWSTSASYGGSTFWWGRNNFAPEVGTNLHDKISSLEVNVSSCQ